jgi:peptide/nickel transport system permease protein
VFPYFLRRALSALVLVFFLASATFVMMFGATGNVARNILGESATEEQVAALSRELGLDQPLPVQYGAWLGKALVGDMGRSWINRQPVADAIGNRLPVTLSMVVTATLAMALISVSVGVAAAVFGGWLDRATQIASVIGFAIPNFWAALILVLVFAVGLRWLPATGYVSFFTSPAGWAAALVLPVSSLVIAGVASASQQVRGAMIDILNQDYIRTLRARGLPSRSILFRHALRNAVPPALTVLSLQFIGMLGGAMVIESVFAMPGLGSLTVQSALVGDLPVLLGIVVILVIVVSLVNLMVDLANAWANPKVRLQ